ncbi:REP-associated tyrosine transposase [Pseudoxanthomonas gei]|uniref:REP-associated tyrosine transposase n=1 Tax=Pseudoxanthomonas gei TaxID=1383030 RepID=UPI003CCD9D72
MDHIGLLRESFRVARAARPCFLLAWVVLPDHLHCVWRLPEGDADNGARWRHIKSYFSRSIDSGERLSERRQEKSERGIWQRRYWERLMRDESHLRQCVDYVHANPQKSMAMSSGWRIGRIPHSIAMWQRGCFRPTGQGIAGRRVKTRPTSQIIRSVRRHRERSLWLSNRPLSRPGQMGWRRAGLDPPSAAASNAGVSRALLRFDAGCRKAGQDPPYDSNDPVRTSPSRT